MPNKSYDRGESFEDEIRGTLMGLQSEHPERVRVFDHPRVTLHDGQEVIPDFVLEYEMPEAKHIVTIECQDRQRSQKDITNKIRTMKALSSSNRFLFVYRDQLPEATGKALEADGTPHVSYDEFVNFVKGLSTSIKHTEKCKPPPPPAIRIVC
jgi:hypothetical protein